MGTARQMCENFAFIPSRVLVILIALLQGGVINYYLVHYNSNNWFFWIAADVAVLFSFLVAFFISYRELKMVHLVRVASQHKGVAVVNSDQSQSSLDAGSFPLSYFAWLVYTVMMTIRVAIIYRNFAFRIEKGVFFGTNMLKFTIALSAVQFILMVAAHHQALPGTAARSIINWLTIMVPFDLMDSVDMFSIFFNEDSKNSLEDVLQYAIIGIASLNIVLSTIPLMILSGSHFGVNRVPIKIQTLYRALQIGAINGPLLFLRVFLWHKQGEEVSLFMLKNIVVIVMVGMEVYESGYEKAVQMEEAHQVDDGQSNSDSSIRRQNQNTALVPYHNI